MRNRIAAASPVLQRLLQVGCGLRQRLGRGGAGFQAEASQQVVRAPHLRPVLVRGRKGTVCGRGGAAQVVRAVAVGAGGQGFGQCDLQRRVGHGFGVAVDGVQPGFEGLHGRADVRGSVTDGGGQQRRAQREVYAGVFGWKLGARERRQRVPAELDRSIEARLGERRSFKHYPRRLDQRRRNQRGGSHPRRQFDRASKWRSAAAQAASPVPATRPAHSRPNPSRSSA